MSQNPGTETVLKISESSQASIEQNEEQKQARDANLAKKVTFEQKRSSDAQKSQSQDSLSIERPDPLEEAFREKREALEKQLSKAITVNYGFTRQGKIRMIPEELTAFQKAEVAKYLNQREEYIRDQMHYEQLIKSN